MVSVKFLEIFNSLIGGYGWEILLQCLTGTNDVSMIQVAGVGIGISVQEVSEL